VAAGQYCGNVAMHLSSLPKPRLGVSSDLTAGFKAQVVHIALTSKLFIVVD
jgi:hypothetical protein